MSSNFNVLKVVFMNEERSPERELLEKWLEAVKLLGPVAKGSIREYKRRCGLKGCKRCARGEGHPTKQLTYYQEGKQKSAFVGPGQFEAFSLAIANGRKLEAMAVEFGLEYLKLLKAAGKRRKG